MKQLIQLILVLVMTATAVYAEDIDVFSNCDNALPPNVLVLFDTSLSMRNQDVYDDSILEYSHDKTDWYSGMKYDDPYRLYYKPSTGGAWLTLGSLWFDKMSHLGNVTCPEAIEAITSKGYFEGKLSSHDGECGGTLVTSKIVATGNYLNYTEYVNREMPKISYALGVESGEPGFDLETYCPTTDYYNYHGNNLGYGDYRVGHGAYNRDEDRVYVKMGLTRPYSSVFHPGGIKVKDLGCEEARNSLRANGWVKAKIFETKTCSCVPWPLSVIAVPKLLVTQNFLNYLDMKRSRRYNGIDALYNVIQNRHNDANFGIMQFDLGHYPTFSSWKSDGGDLAAPCGSSLADLKTVLYGHDSDADIEYGQPLHFGRSKSDIGKDTPLSESLIEAGLYFSGQPSWFNSYTIPGSFFGTTRPLHSGSTNGRSYKSPIECPKQGNHVIIITDGAPSDDFALVDPSLPDHRMILTKPFPHYNELTGNPTTSTIGDYDRDEEKCAKLFGSCLNATLQQAWVDDVAAFLYDKDLSSLEGRQSVLTHAISFRMDADASSTDENLLRNTAKNGHGMYAVTKSKQELEDALSLILEGVIKVSTFSSAVTPVRQDDLTYSGDETLLTTFHVSSGERGKGNVKKYRRDGDVIMGYGPGGTEAPLLTGKSVNLNVKDLWSDNALAGDDEDTPDEGLAGVLYKRLADITFQDNADWSSKLNQVANDRKIYGVKIAGGNGNNTRYAVADLRTLTTGPNPEITLPKADGDVYEADRLKQFLAEDVYGLSLAWPLGHIVHPDVVVAQYPTPGNGNGNAVYPMLFVGANDGMLHCFDMTTGQEKWALVPPDQTDRLYLLENTMVHPWFIDGEMVLYHTITTEKDPHGKVMRKKRTPQTLIFGERRGGSAYHLVDVTRTTETANNAPGYVAMVGNTSEWGQSWSTPRLCQVKVRPGTGDGSKKTAFLVGGGYDTNQDMETPEEDTKGQFVGIYDLEGGEIKKISTYNNGTEIEACIVGARIIDHDHDAERIFSRIYAGDLEGHVYHFSDELDQDENSLWVTKTYEEMNGNWDRRHLLFKAHYEDGDTSELIKQKIFYAPMYGTACDMNLVYVGTGDREKPDKKTVANSLYAVKEQWAGDALLRADLSHFTIANPQVDGGIFEEYTEGGIDSSGNAVTALTDFSTSKGWYFDFPREGEKVISEISVLGSILVFGTYTPQVDGMASSRCDADEDCKTGEGRVYIVNACPWTFEVKSIKTGARDPMPQPAIIFDKDTGKVLISTGDGGVYDPDLPVVEPEYWKSSTSGN
ncbi:type IV pili system adhesin PilY [Desulfoluna limicola]|uniref:Type IV pili system adhesin PilY n=1 Tax=Desulfoluna limicola TaxID=2810562 RepID=A0ABM7PPI8_9BACT|nr:PilC/PilY family type IV pilus protein [Desulfoluna limicola]BCS99261.1 type IV pili system adhesin PilY [Desulfoluna limicola]